MVKYTKMACAAIKKGKACAQITGNAQLIAIGAHKACGCSCPVPTCKDDDAKMVQYTKMTCGAIKKAKACAQITGNEQLIAIGAHTACGCSCPVSATIESPTANPTTSRTTNPTPHLGTSPTQTHTHATQRTHWRMAADAMCHMNTREWARCCCCRQRSISSGR